METKEKQIAFCQRVNNIYMKLTGDYNKDDHYFDSCSFLSCWYIGGQTRENYNDRQVYYTRKIYRLHQRVRSQSYR